MHKLKQCVKKFYPLLTIIYFLSFWAILRANYYYRDDLTRASGGMKGWDHFSRYVSVWLSNVIHGDTYLADAAPLPQILAILIMALCGCFMIYLLNSNENKLSYFSLVGAVPLALTPYYLECMSYRYDAPYMAISILASIAPFLFYKGSKKGLTAFVVASIIGILIMCMSYQASSGIFPMLTVALVFKMWTEGDEAKKILRFIGAAALAYIVALCIYKFLILTPVYSYVTTYQAPVSNIVPKTIYNMKTYFSVIIRDFKPIWLILTGLIVLAYIELGARNSKRNKALSALVALLAALVMLLLSFGVYAVLDESFFNPRAMYGFGVYLAIIATCVCTAEKAYPEKAVCTALSWLFIVFAFVYGNCIRVQAEYTDFRIQLIISDLNELEEFNNDNLKMIKFKGDIGYSPIIENIPRDNYTMLDSLLPKPLGDEDVLSSVGFYYFYNIPNIVRYDYTTMLDENMPVLKDTVYHTIRGNGTDFVIELK